ncbi:MAG: 5-formyltetrahydrofolate cyclo-ligase [Nitratireductor sp.]|nr:5-formyltetrahydrofolate cyclo-ligase [Nitratireductor sp.]
MDRTETGRQKKARLRDEVLGRRDALEAMQRIEFSLKAAEIGAAHLKIEPGMVVSGFFPIRSEIDARPLMEIVRQRGARLCLPVVLDKTTIVFRELVRGAELVPTGFGTSGPGEDAPVLDPQLLIMPLSVFDRTGGRIGYGAGHYDRAIARLLAKGMTPRLEGLAFSCQEVEAVPVEDHDQPLNAIITEREYVVTGR